MKSEEFVKFCRKKMNRFTETYKSFIILLINQNKDK